MLGFKNMTDTGVPIIGMTIIGIVLMYRICKGPLQLGLVAHPKPYRTQGIILGLLAS